MPEAVFATALAIAASSLARAEEEPFDVQHAFFVAGERTTTISVIDTGTDRIVGTIDAAVEPAQIALSTATGRLAVIDGSTPQLIVLDAERQADRRIGLDFVPRRFTLSPDGLTAALADPASGTIVFVELLKGRVTPPIKVAPPIRDMMFGADGATLYVAGDNLPGVAVIDAAQARLLRPLSVETPSGSGEAALTRSPTGRRLYARRIGGGSVDVFDLDGGRALPPIDAGSGASAAFPSALGAYLLLPDSEQATLGLLRGEDGGAPVMLKAAHGVSNVYTAWLDTVAFLPSAATRSVLVYDLAHARLDGEIALGGAPLQGAVTPDGRKLYLPLRDTAQVVVIDAASRHQIAAVPLPANPVSAALAGGYGVCH